MARVSVNASILILLTAGLSISCRYLDEKGQTTSSVSASKENDADVVDEDSPCVGYNCPTTAQTPSPVGLSFDWLNDIPREEESIPPFMFDWLPNFLDNLVQVPEVPEVPENSPTNPSLPIGLLTEIPVGGSNTSTTTTTYEIDDKDYEPSSFPQIVEVGLLDENGNFAPTCSGVIIGVSTVLSAAHCLTNLYAKEAMDPYCFDYIFLDEMIAELKVRVSATGVVKSLFNYTFRNSYFYTDENDIVALHLSSPISDDKLACIGTDDNPNFLYGAGQRNQGDASIPLPSGERDGCTPFSSSVPETFAANCQENDCKDHSVAGSDASYLEYMISMEINPANGNSGGGAFTPYEGTDTKGGMKLYGILSHRLPDGKSVAFVRVDQGSSYNHNWILDTLKPIDETISVCE